MKIYSKTIADEVSAKMATIQVWDTDAKNGTFEVIASTGAIDRHGESIDPNGWKLENYMKNPVIIFGHDYWSLENIVGKATDVQVVNGQLIVKGVFASEESNPKAQMLRRMYDEWLIRTVSVGLRPLSRDVNDRDIITSAELLELSFVPVPANPEALRLSKELGAESIVDDTKDPLQEVKEDIKSIKDILTWLTTTIKSIADDKANKSEMFEKKEQIQSAVRSLNEVLRDFKKR